MVGLKTGMPRCAKGSSAGSSHGRASELGEGGSCDSSAPKKWSGWTGRRGVADRDGVSEGVRLADIVPRRVRWVVRVQLPAGVAGVVAVVVVVVESIELAIDPFN